MLADGRLAQAKGLLVMLMRAAAARHERVALLCFAGHRSALRVPPTRAGAWREDWITPIGGGGGTAIEPALRRAALLLARHRRQRPDDRCHLWLLTDARTVDNPPRPAGADRIVLIDFDHGRRARHRAAVWARRWQVDTDTTAVSCLRAETLLTSSEGLAGVLAGPPVMTGGSPSRGSVG